MKTPTSTKTHCDFKKTLIAAKLVSTTTIMEMKMTMRFRIDKESDVADKWNVTVEREATAQQMNDI